MGIGRRVEEKSNDKATSSISNRRDTTIEKPKDMTSKKVTNFKRQKPKYTFGDIVLPNHVRDKVMDTLAYKEKSEIVFEKWGLSKTHKHSKKIGINLYGEPGTGKTMAAHAIASYLQRDLIIVNYADIESKYVGDTPKNLTQAFETAKATNSILFFDEADAILSKRVTNMTSATDVSVNQTRSVMLMLLNEHQDIIIFATNFISNFDPAFMRRILAHIKFELPDYQCRKSIWRMLIPYELPNNLDIDEIARRYEGVSGSDISNAILMAAFKGARSGQGFVRAEYFQEAIEGIIESKKANMASNYKVKIEDRIVTEEYVKKQIGARGTGNNQ